MKKIYIIYFSVCAASMIVFPVLAYITGINALISLMCITVAVSGGWLSSMRKKRKNLKNSECN